MQVVVVGVVMLVQLHQVQEELVGVVMDLRTLILKLVLELQTLVAAVAVLAEEQIMAGVVMEVQV
jgi:hypothetical protein